MVDGGLPQSITLGQYTCDLSAAGAFVCPIGEMTIPAHQSLPQAAQLDVSSGECIALAMVPPVNYTLYSTESPQLLDITLEGGDEGR